MYYISYRPHPVTVSHHVRHERQKHKKRSNSYPTPIESKNIKMSEDFGEGELFYQHYVARQDSYNELQKLIEKEEKKLSSSAVPTKDEKKKKEDSVKKVDPLSGSTLLFAKCSIHILIHH